VSDDASTTLVWVGGIGTGLALLSIVVTVVRRAGKTRVVGTVVEHEVTVDAGDQHHWPIVEYVAPSGEKRRVRHDMGHARPLEVGKKRIEVWHHDDPAKTITDEPPFPFPTWMTYVWPVVALIAGLVLRYR
jgi:hypothetical protein